MRYFISTLSYCILEWIVSVFIHIVNVSWFVFNAGQLLGYSVCDTKSCPNRQPGYGGVRWPTRGHFSELQSIISSIFKIL